MWERSQGFTFVEVVVVIAIGAILVSMAVRGFGDAASGMSVRGARESFASLQARARASAIERGEQVLLRVDLADDRVWIEGDDGSTITALDFGDDRDVEIHSSASSPITVCMNPRGFADTSCNSFGSSSVDLAFVQGPQRSEATILPLGQVEW